MEFFKIRRDIPFMKNALAFNLISLITFLAAVFFLFSRGVVNLWYGRQKKLKAVSIGTIWRPDGGASVATSPSTALEK
jgi:hypothetical protein